MKKMLVLLAVCTILTLVMTPAVSFAQSQVALKPLHWKLVFLSPYGGCDVYQYQMTHVYAEETSKYFKMYKVANDQSSEPQCMSVKNYAKSTGDGVDLLVLVYGYELGRNELNLNSVGGFYSHQGDDKSKNHTVVICDCSNFKFSRPTFTLSYELSRMILYYEGYDKSIYRGYVETIGAKNDKCEEGDSASCDGLYTKIRGEHYFTSMMVMAPYKPAVDPTSIPDSDNQNIPNSPYVINTQKAITNWWIQGKISDVDYETALGYLTGIDVKITNKNESGTMILFDGPKDLDKKHPDVLNNDVNLNLTDQQKNGLLSRVNIQNIESKPASDAPNALIPLWLKEKVHTWSNDNTVSFDDYLNTIKYFLKSQ